MSRVPSTPSYASSVSGTVFPVLTLPNSNVKNSRAVIDSIAYSGYTGTIATGAVTLAISITDAVGNVTYFFLPATNATNTNFVFAWPDGLSLDIAPVGSSYGLVTAGFLNASGAAVTASQAGLVHQVTVTWHTEHY